jgi:hypothetical protein
MSNNDNFRVTGASTEVGFALTDGTGSGPGPGSGMGSGPGSGIGSGTGSGCPSGKLIKYPSLEQQICRFATFFSCYVSVRRKMIPAGEWFVGNHKPGDSPSDLQFLKRLFAGGFSIPRSSQNREAVLPIINHGIMHSSFYRDYRQRKNNPKVDSPMRVPRSIYNEAIPV